MRKIIFLLAVLTLGLFSSAQAQIQKPAPAQKTSFKITGRFFENGGSLPSKFTCDSLNLSPGLKWEGAPAGTKSLALIVEDPDAPNGDWVHWVAYNIPATTNSLDEGVPAIAKLPNGTQQGVNSFGKSGYGGPCPPKGKGIHRYFFQLYAVNTTLNLSPKSTDSTDLKQALEGHILATAQVVGKFGH